jgi:DNA (cytosine-5)-methyltransferase 1
VYHPSGLRNYTLRERASLQTFPHSFIFHGKSAEQLRQIGNAVPPAFARALFESLKEWLAAKDAAEAA